MVLQEGPSELATEPVTTSQYAQAASVLSGPSMALGNYVKPPKPKYAEIASQVSATPEPQFQQRIPPWVAHVDIYAFFGISASSLNPLNNRNTRGMLNRSHHRP